MLRVGLSGGIGSGKSTVSARLAALGAVVVDADRVAREVVEPGMPCLAAIRDRFGPGVVGPDGALDRPALAALVFGDDTARRDLEAITHPAIRARSAELFAAAPADAVVVHDIPLLVEMGLTADYALTVVVHVEEGERLRRLVELRGMQPEQARARVAAQASDDGRRAAADVWLDNGGDVEDLHGAVDALWHGRLVPFEGVLREGRAPAAPDPVGSLPEERRRRYLDRVAAAGEDPARLRERGLLLVGSGPGATVVWADPVEPVTGPLPRR